jgi:hypothetical protein
VNVKEGNEEGVNFYISLCTKTSFIVEEPFTYHRVKDFMQVIQQWLGNSTRIKVG